MGKGMDFDEAEALREAGAQESALHLPVRSMVAFQLGPSGEEHGPDCICEECLADVDAGDFRDAIDKLRPDDALCGASRGSVECGRCRMSHSCPKSAVRFSFSASSRAEEGEMSLGVLRVDLYRRLRLATKRKAPAFSSRGTPLSEDYCEVFVNKNVAVDIMLRNALPLSYFC